MQVLSGKFQINMFVLVFLLFGGSIFKVSGAPGDFDPTFGGGDGIVVSDVGIEDRGYTIVSQPDGKIVVAGRSRLSGNSYPDLVVVRYNSDGSFDQSFGTNGIARNNVNSISLLPEINALTLQSDGKIVATCSFRTTNGTLTKSGVLRYNTNGSLDATFGNGGIVVIDAVVDRAVVIQPDGKIITGGGNGTSPTTDFQILRLNPNGSIDTTFDTDGILRIDFNNSGDGVFGLALQTDGKIVAVGRTYSAPADGTRDNFALARILPNGTLDTTFGTGGKVVTNFENLDDVAFAVAIQPDGKIVAAGRAPVGEQNNYDFGLARYNTDGSLDTSFGNGGKVRTEFGGLDTIFAVKLQRNGKIVAGGMNLQGGGSAGAVARYNADGSLDNSFGAGGKVYVFFYANDEIRGLDIQTDGKIVAAGTANGGDIIGKIAVARLIGDGVSRSASPFDFDGDRKADISVYRPSEGFWYLLRSQQGFSAERWGISSDKIMPADYDGDGKTDLAIYRGGVWWIFASADNSVRAVQFGENQDKTVPADYDGDGKADPAVYRGGTWYFLQSTNGFTAFQFGLADDKPVPADYDGDGKADAAVYRDGVWYLQRTTAGFAGVQFGVGSDAPVPAAFVR